MTWRRLTALALAALLCGAAAAAAPDTPAAAAATAPQVAASPDAAAPARALPGRPPAAQPPGYAPGPSAGNLLQTIFALSLVLALLGALAWFMKRFGPRGQSAAGGLRIVGALNLGGRERIMVVEIGNQWIVVGAAPGRVNALATMPRQEGAPLDAALHPHTPSATSFSEWLKQTIDKRNAK